jgi:DNA polymerase-3 subunit epsilon
VAHNAAFDRKFWQAELALAGLAAPHPFACTVMLSRRLYPQAPNHQLGTLVAFHRLPRAGQAHRALADAEMAAALLCRIQQDLRGPAGTGRADHDWLMRVQACPKAKIGRLQVVRHRRTAVKLDAARREPRHEPAAEGAEAP